MQFRITSFDRDYWFAKPGRKNIRSVACRHCVDRKNNHTNAIFKSTVLENDYAFVSLQRTDQKKNHTVAICKSMFLKNICGFACQHYADTKSDHTVAVCKSMFLKNICGFACQHCTDKKNIYIVAYLQNHKNLNIVNCPFYCIAVRYVIICDFSLTSSRIYQFVFGASQHFFCLIYMFKNINVHILN